MDKRMFIKFYIQKMLPIVNYLFIFAADLRTSDDEGEQKVPLLL
jgi:hypothetical protein